MEVIVDLTQKPAFEGMLLKHDTSAGIFTGSLEDIQLWFAKGQQEKETSFLGSEMEQEVLRNKERMVPFNVNLLDFLLGNPAQIPEAWKPYRVYFWGTIHRGGSGAYVRYLRWLNGQWTWGYSWMHDQLLHNAPAAMRLL